MHGTSVVAGVGESDYFVRGRSPDSEFQLACTAIRRAAEDAGLDVAEIDGFVSYNDPRNDPLRLSRALGLRSLRWTSQSFAGGGNNVGAMLQMADAAITAGYARHVVAFRALAQGQFGRFGQSRAGGRVPPVQAWTMVYGLLSPAEQCALHTRRYMHDHGISQEALCEISLACYANAQRNPRAVRHGQPLTREQYHESRWIVEPFHLYDCCPENDGAAAVLVTSPERARDLRAPSVSIVAAAQGNGPGFGLDSFQTRWFPGTFYREVGELLWQRAGVKPADCDVVQFYENFTGPVLMTLAEMGFCEPGELEAFVADGALAGPDARLPFNTSGGNLGEAYIHGFELVNEAVRQVRGESTCQVAGVERSLVVAGPGYAPGSAVLFGPA
ncbi:MAG: acetyl-CoA acetyltransferase [Proteobacteria bacterium]|nr:acetyl-CoA acetyltransferase [Pseudomonadota bacterium]